MIWDILGCVGLAYVMASPANGPVAAVRDRLPCQQLWSCLKCLSWWFALTLSATKIVCGASWQETWFMAPVAFLSAAVWLKLYKRL